MRRSPSPALLAGLPLVLALGCSGSESGTMPPGNQGGKTSSGQGGAASGGTQAKGGSSSTSGGTSNAQGGSTNSSSGGSSTGGVASGGASNGGSSASNGGSNNGGSTSMGGTSSAGGRGGAANGGAASGGTTAAGGAKANGGTSSGGTSSGGTKSSGGSSNGGTSAGGGSTAMGGTTAMGGSGGATNCTPPVPGSKGTNPLFSDQYTADPAPLVHNCTFYIGCGHDEGSTGFVLREWFVLSSTDMVHWNKTVALRLSDFKWANANAWAAQIVGPKNGKFYWYVPVNETGGGMAIGVAVADSPTGPWKDALGKALVNDALEMSNFNYSQASQTVYTIDPTVFIDDDGQAYLHYGGFGRMVEGKLNDDMISFNGKLQETTPQGFFEAPFLFKRNGTYYEVYAAGANPATIDYATSTSPMGPWTRRGRILDALPGVPGQDAPTSHPGVAQFAGQWYLVYHLSNGPNGGGTYKREVAVDKLTFNSDGTIQKVTPSSGLSF
ncbi:MAG: family 43 glycosylhydrolase [Myxococcota bacterium]